MYTGYEWHPSVVYKYINGRIGKLSYTINIEYKTITLEEWQNSGLFYKRSIWDNEDYTKTVREFQAKSKSLLS